MRWKLSSLRTTTSSSTLSVTFSPTPFTTGTEGNKSDERNRVFSVCGLTVAELALRVVAADDEQQKQHLTRSHSSGSGVAVTLRAVFVSSTQSLGSYGALSCLQCISGEQ
jgi:hypothetical protein